MQCHSILERHAPLTAFYRWLCKTFINYKGSEHKSLSSIGHWLSIPIYWLIHWLVSIVTDYQFHWLVTSIAAIMLTLEISQQDRIECKKQIDLYFFTHLPCHRQWILLQHCQNSLWIQSAVTLGIHGYLTMVGWKFMINNRTEHENWSTFVNYTRTKNLLIKLIFKALYCQQHIVHVLVMQHYWLVRICNQQSQTLFN